MLKITVVWAPEPRSTQILELMLSQGATLADAMSKLISVVPEAMAPDFNLGSEGSCYVASIWGKFKSPDTLLKEDDRIELTRGLRVDPKEARRQRYQKQNKVPASKRTRSQNSQNNPTHS